MNWFWPPGVLLVALLISLFSSLVHFFVLPKLKILRVLTSLFLRSAQLFPFDLVALQFYFCSHVFTLRQLFCFWFSICYNILKTGILKLCPFVYLLWNCNTKELLKVIEFCYGYSIDIEIVYAALFWKQHLNIVQT